MSIVSVGVSYVYTTLTTYLQILKTLVLNIWVTGQFNSVLKYLVVKIAFHSLAS